MTTLSGKDLYPDVLGHLANIENLRGHPYEFYYRLGFSLIGAMPDANGWGKARYLYGQALLREATGFRYFFRGMKP